MGTGCLTGSYPTTPQCQRIANFAHTVVRLATRCVQRMEPNQIVSMRSLLEKLGLPPWRNCLLGRPGTTRGRRWTQQVLELYTLLESAVPKFRQRLEELTHLKSFTHNRTPLERRPLRNLASSARYFMVDAWPNAATTEIDKIRPKSRQILPRQVGPLPFYRHCADSFANQQIEHQGWTDGPILAEGEVYLSVGYGARQQHCVELRHYLPPRLSLRRM